MDGIKMKSIEGHRCWREPGCLFENLSLLFQFCVLAMFGKLLAQFLCVLKQEFTLQCYVKIKGRSSLMSSYLNAGQWAPTVCCCFSPFTQIRDRHYERYIATFMLCLYDKCCIEVKHSKLSQKGMKPLKNEVVYLLERLCLLSSSMPVNIGHVLHIVCTQN